MAGWSELAALGAAAGAALKARGETVAVAESSAGGLVAAALLSVPGASAYFRGGAVVYTVAARRAYTPAPGAIPDGMRSASEPYAAWLAAQTRAHLGAEWALAETGAAGPAGNRYGDPPGHTCLAVSGPAERVLTLETESADRAANMFAFAEAALSLLRESLKTQA